MLALSIRLLFCFLLLSPCCVMGMWLVGVRWELLIRACYPVVHSPNPMPCMQFGVLIASPHHLTLFPVGEISGTLCAKRQRSQMQ
uniref:Putative secreted peptide n=1 Tax=Anopheles braziliensis TaxID=58242 RepID=A0A2M3ZX21_9DIPT